MMLTWRRASCKPRINPLESFRQLPVIEELVDGQNRQIRYLRVSLTDRCNFRCTYCMPEEGVDLAPKSDVLNFEELMRVVNMFAQLGVTKIRLTGGEPTLRKDIVLLVKQLKAIEGLESVQMTTNGILLPKFALELKKAGLNGVNISLDTLEPTTFFKLSRRSSLSSVLEGIDAALDAGLPTKINTVALKHVNENEIADLCEFAWTKGAVPRFIEHMPMSSGDVFSKDQFLPASDIRQAIETRFGAIELVKESSVGDAGPSRYYRVLANHKTFGNISAMTENFCGVCNRVRLSATGDLHGCLGYDDTLSLRELMRDGASDRDIQNTLRTLLKLKRSGHQFTDSGAGAPQKHMVSIGG